MKSTQPYDVDSSCFGSIGHAARTPSNQGAERRWRNTYTHSDCDGKRRALAPDDLAASKTYIAEELRIHPQSLRRLNTSPQMLKLSEIFGCLSRIGDGDMVLPSKIWMMNPTDDDRKSIVAISNALQKASGDTIAFRKISGGNGMFFDISTLNPEILTIEGSRVVNGKH